MANEDLTEVPVHAGRRRWMLSYRMLLVVILGAVLALVLAAFSTRSPLLSSRTILLLFAGVLMLLAVALEIVFRDIRRLRK